MAQDGSKETQTASEQARSIGFINLGEAVALKSAWPGLLIAAMKKSCTLEPDTTDDEYEKYGWQLSRLTGARIAFWLDPKAEPGKQEPWSTPPFDVQAARDICAYLKMPAETLAVGSSENKQGDLPPLREMAAIMNRAANYLREPSSNNRDTADRLDFYAVAMWRVANAKSGEAAQNPSATA